MAAHMRNCPAGAAAILGPGDVVIFPHGDAHIL